MMQNGLLTKDVFSWSIPGKYWMSHEWLFEFMIAGMRWIFGKYHILLYTFFSIFGCLGVLFFTNIKGVLKNIPYTLVTLLFYILLGVVFVQTRPHLLQFFLFTIMMYLLYDQYQNKDSKKIYFLPVLTIVWANVHGGSSNLPYLFCFLFLIGGLFSFSFSKIEAKRLSKKQLQRYFIVMILCMISTCINLHGWKLFLYPYQNILDSRMIQNIAEWKSTSLQEPYHIVYYLYLVFVVLTFRLSRKKIRGMDFLLFGVTAYLGLRSIRFWMYVYITMSFVLLDYVKIRKEDRFSIPSLFLLSFAFLLFFAFSFPKITTIPSYYALNEKVISLLKEKNPKRLYHMYDYGGELIYHNQKVFIDGRADLYGKYNYQDYLDISYGRNMESLIQKYDFDYYLVSSKYPIAMYLKDHDYTLIYEKDDILLYEKSS